MIGQGLKRTRLCREAEGGRGEDEGDTILERREGVVGLKEEGKEPTRIYLEGNGNGLWSERMSTEISFI